MKNFTDLIKACKEGDEKSQRELYHRMKARWMGICVRYVKDGDESKDVFQEATLKIFNDLDKLKEPDAFESWARRIIINASLNYIKQQKAYLFTLDASAMHRGEDIDRSDEQVILKLDQEHLINLINTIPEGYRRVLNLSIIDGFSHSEIAEMLNINESTSRSQLSKAKRYLKDILESFKKLPHEKAVGQ